MAQGIQIYKGLPWMLSSTRTWIQPTPEQLAAEIGKLRAALEFATDQCDELINRHYGGELPCDEVSAEKWAEVRALTNGEYTR